MRDTPGQKDKLFQRIEGLVQGVRRRRNLRLFLKGSVATAAFSLAVFFVSSWAMDRLLYSDRAVLVIRGLSWITAGSFFLYQLVLPFLRRTSDRQIALYIEENEPELESALVTSLEVGKVPAAGVTLTNDLHRRLLADTIDRCEQIDYGKGIERSAFQRASGGLAFVAGMALLLTLLSPAFLRHGASLLLFPWNTAAMDNPYRIVTSPTDVVFAKGADVSIKARLQGFSDDNTQLVMRAGEAAPWQRQAMVDGADHDATFASRRTGRAENSERERAVYSDLEILLIAQDESFEYFVEAGGIRSTISTVEMIDLPYTDRIDLQYTFPGYAGLKSERVEDGGDVAALKGTKVELWVTPTMPTDGVRIVVEGEDPMDLLREQDGSWLHTFKVNNSGFYHLEMKDARGRFARASADYAINPLDDRPPSIEFRTPGRDLKVNKIEEIFVEVVARDDYGVTVVELEFSINGAGVQRKRLVAARKESTRKNVTAGYTFFLEEYELQDGDFISYYATARDGRPGAGERTESTDIYFLEIRPFSQDYRRADSGGGGGGEGGADAALSKRQKEIVAATFALLRDRKKISAKEFRESVNTVSLSQGKVREQVKTLMSRMGNRLASDDNFAKIMEHLEAALTPMERATEQLAKMDVSGALLTEQEALAALQRAEGMFRDVRVSFDASSGGGSGSGEIAEDLADLFELELEKLRNQYETVQRGEQQSAEKKIDELDERLRELARRQQKQNDRKKRLGKRSSGGGQGGEQQDLLDDTEELARELERLSREQSSPEMRQTAQSLQRAVDQMKRSGSEGQAKAGSAGAGAERALEEARRLLDKSRQTSVAEGVDQVSSRAQAISEGQARIQQELEEMARNRQSREAGAEGSRPGQAGQVGRSALNAQERAALQRLLERKRQVQEQVAGLEEDLDRLARQSRSDQPELARNLQLAANELRTSGVGKKIEYSMAVLGEGNMERGVLFEEAIADDLDSLRDNVEGAAESLGQGSEAETEDSLEKTRELVQGLESLEQRLRDRVAGLEESGSVGGSNPKPSPEGERGVGETSGEQGKQGERGGTGEQESGGEQGENGKSSSGRSQAGQSGDQAGGKGEGSEGDSGNPSDHGQEGRQGQGGKNTTAGSGGREAAQQGAEGAAVGPESGQQAGMGRPSMGSSNGADQFQPGAFSEEDLRQLSREVRERIAETQALRQSLEQQGVETADLRDIERSIRRFDTRKLVNDPLAIESLRKSIEDLRHFEFGLWRNLEGDRGAVHSPRTERAPEGYEEQAERYFRALAGGDGGSN